MRSVTELVDRRDLSDPVAAFDQDLRVAREGCGVAGAADDERNAALRQLLRLRERALAWWVEHDCVELVQFRRQQRAAEQVARLGLERLQALRHVRCLAKRIDRAGLGIVSIDACGLRQPKRKGANAAK